MAGFERQLADELEAIREAGLWRELRRVDSVEANRIKIEGREYLNFSSNDYLGLAGHPALGQAAKEAVEKFGVGSGASRLICGRWGRVTNWKPPWPTGWEPNQRWYSPPVLPPRRGR